MHPVIFSAGFENGGHWSWPSRSFWPFWLRILGNSACPSDNWSPIWARITKFAPNMHPGIRLVGIGNGGHWPWPSRTIWPFGFEFSENRFVCMITCNKYELESQNLPQLCIKGYSQLVLKMEVIDLDLQCHLAILSTQETAFNVVRVYWSRPGQGMLHVPNVLLFLIVNVGCRYLWHIVT